MANRKIQRQSCKGKSSKWIHQVLPKISEFQSQLSCSLCRGYLIDATTINKCLHSFCRSCIVRYLQACNACPVCDIVLDESNLRSDKLLQRIVYKIVPGLHYREGKRRRKFFSRFSQPVRGKWLHIRKRAEFARRSIIYYDNDMFSISLRYGFAGAELSKAWQPLLLNYSECTSTSRVEAYLQCPGRITVEIIKKFIRLKFNISHAFMVEVYDTSGNQIDDRYTLIDVAYIYSCRKIGALTLHFLVYIGTSTNENLSSVSLCSTSRHAGSMPLKRQHSLRNAITRRENDNQLVSNKSCDSHMTETRNIQQRTRDKVSEAIVDRTTSAAAKMSRLNAVSFKPPLDKTEQGEASTVERTTPDTVNTVNKALLSARFPRPDDNSGFDGDCDNRRVPAKLTADGLFQPGLFIVNPLMATIYPTTSGQLLQNDVASFPNCQLYWMPSSYSYDSSKVEGQFSYGAAVGMMDQNFCPNMYGCYVSGTHEFSVSYAADLNKACLFGNISTVLSSDNFGGESSNFVGVEPAKLQNLAGCETSVTSSTASVVEPFHSQNAWSLVSNSKLPITATGFARCLQAPTGEQNNVNPAVSDDSALAKPDVVASNTPRSQACSVSHTRNSDQRVMVGNQLTLTEQQQQLGVSSEAVDVSCSPNVHYDQAEVPDRESLCSAADRRNVQASTLCGTSVQRNTTVAVVSHSLSGTLQPASSAVATATSDSSGHSL